MSSESEKLEIGTVIAKRYTIGKCLGTGGMGAVYLAEDSFVNGDLVAIKILHPDLVIDAKQSQRFMREVQLMRKVDHANVVRTFDVGSDGDIVFFTMEYVPGKSLEAFIEGQSFPKEEITQLIIGVASGLEAIHKVNIIHRDLKPANILILENFQPKITDFGVARPEYSELTAHNEIIGSALYIAPEVWLGTKLTSSVDLYSFGVVLYELTTGVLPFDGDSPASLMRMHLEFKPTPPKELNPEIPVWLNKLILKLLAKSPEERIRDAADLIDYVEAQTNTGQRKAVSEDTFIKDLELAASQLDSGKENIAQSRNKTLVMSYGKIGENPARSFQGEILATVICMLIGVAAYLFLNGILDYLRKSIYPDLESVTSDPSKWNFETLGGLSLASGFLLLVVLKTIVSGASLYFPIGAATGSLKSTLRLFLFGVVWCSLVVLGYLVAELATSNSVGGDLLLTHPDGFSLVLSSLRCGLASVTLDPKIWSIQNVIFEQGTVFFPEGVDLGAAKVTALFQSLPLIVLAILTCKMGRYSGWRIIGIILGVLTAALYYLAGGAETQSLLKHSNPSGLTAIIIIFAGIILFRRLSVLTAARRN